jgi:hypothetical protein
MSRSFLGCLVVVWIASVVGCAERGKTDPPAGPHYPDVERRLKEAIEEQGKHQVKSMKLTKQPDGSYAGTMTTVSGGTVALKNVIVREKGISWNETIDQTGRGRTLPRPTPTGYEIHSSLSDSTIHLPSLRTMRYRLPEALRFPS